MKAITRAGICITLLAAFVETPAWAQICSETDLATSDAPFFSTPAFAVGESRVYAGGTAVYELDPVSLVQMGGVNLLDHSVGGAAATLETGAEAVFWTTESLTARRLEGFLLDSVWSQNLRRSGCPNDSIRSAPAVALRAAATPAFQAAYAVDLVLVGTAYQPCDISATGHRTDNRIFALDAETGLVMWTFNVFGSYDVDRISGLAIDPSNDLVIATAERTHSSSQHSVWAVDLVTGSLAWSANHGRIQTPPVLAGGRLYVATLAGNLRALDPVTGNQQWSFNTGTPLQIEPTVVTLDTGEVLVAVADHFGQVRVIRDDGSSASPVTWLQLPDGDPATDGFGASVEAVSNLVAGPGGQALVGANDGQLYPLDLVTGTVGTPVAVDASSSSVERLLLEPPGFTPTGSVLTGTSAGTLARFCTTIDAPACSNGVDDDGDGLVDYAGGDPGCSDATDVSEVSPVLALVVTGTAQGGSVNVVIAGEEVIVPTSATASAATVAAALAAFIEQNPALREIGATAFAQGSELWISDPLDSASTDDPGISLKLVGVFADRFESQ